jgi:predicted DNA-binding transcriptional regulator
MKEKQIDTISFEREISRKIVREHPEIADWYRTGLFQRGIVQRGKFCSRYNIATEEIAMSCVSLALHELMPEEERRKIEEKRKEDGAKIGGGNSP